MPILLTSCSSWRLRPSYTLCARHFPSRMPISLRSTPAGCVTFHPARGQSIHPLHPVCRNHSSSPQELALKARQWERSSEFMKLCPGHTPHPCLPPYNHTQSDMPSFPANLLFPLLSFVVLAHRSPEATRQLFLHKH